MHESEYMDMRLKAKDSWKRKYNADNNYSQFVSELTGEKYMQNELISIIVPVYNVMEYLEECVQSICAQTYRNIEIILVDDGSTDNSGKKCDELAKADSRIRVIHKKNGGLSDARNRGIEEARGQFVGFVDSDDWIEPDMYHLLYTNCIINSSDISVCGYYRDYLDKSIKGNNKKEGTFLRDEALSLLLEGVYIQDHAVTKLYRKELWQNVRFPIDKIYEDIRTTYRVFLNSHNVTVIDKPLYHYRQRAGSIVRSGFNDKKLEWINALNELEDNSEIQQNIEWKKILTKRNIRVKISILRELLLYGDKKIWNQYKRIEKEYIRVIKNNRKLLLNDNSFSKVFKLMALLSVFPANVMEFFFSSSLIKKYMDKEYKYFR